LRCGETESLSFAVKFTEFQTCLGTDGALGGVDANAFHCGHVNHEAVVTNGFASDTMASPTNGNENVVFAGNADAGDNVGSTSAPGDYGGTPINHGVGQSASFVIACISGIQGLPAHRGSELLNGGFWDHWRTSN